MKDSIIIAENLSKRYLIGHQDATGDGIRHIFEQAFRNPGRWLKERREKRRLQEEEFWALKDVSFEIKKGEVVGIIGRNGAGKSTLLKILSRITEPTTGRIEIAGRVASLLEVGTGFHGDLSGRENIFLNGAILGMTKVEIKKKFDEIVAFSEIEKFLDTPVKRYSSGMFVRLAFAVAAHLEPEILIVDEVLAVGDSAFQKKCIGKMQDVATKEGRTVLYVSHNMASIIQFCDHGIMMEKGRVVTQGPIDSVIKAYLSSASHSAVWKPAESLGELRKSRKLFFSQVQLCDESGTPSTEIEVRKSFSVSMEYEAMRPLKSVELTIRIFTSDGNPVMTSLLSDFDQERMGIEKKGCYRASVKIPEMFLMPGSYSMNVSAHAVVGETYDFLPGIFNFTILDTGTNYTKYQHNHLMGVVIKTLTWQDEMVAG